MDTPLSRDDFLLLGDLMGRLGATLANNAPKATVVVPAALDLLDRVMS